MVVANVNRLMQLVRERERKGGRRERGEGGREEEDEREGEERRGKWEQEGKQG